MGYRQLRLCSGGGGFEALPDPGTRLDLDRAARILRSQRIAVTEARVLLIVSLEPEVTISRSGRLLFKTTDSATAARAFDRLDRLLGLTAGASNGASPVRSR